MRLPRRIFLNVVIFVSSFLVVSYHLSSIVPQDGTVHNVLYRYLFRTIFLFRPRAPAAPCSRSFLLSYCSTPPLKRKIKFSLQTVPFVPTQAAFFSAAGGVVIRRTFSAGAGQRGLESAAQFSTGCIVIGGTVCRAASFIQVVILHTIPESRRWNPPHSLRRAGLLSAAQFRCGVHRGAKKMVVIGRTIRTFFCGRQVVIHSTILCIAFFIRFPNCVSANSPGKYNLAGKILSASPSKKFSSSPLLSSAHFRQWGCYRAHSFQTVEYWRLLLSTAHF